MRKYSEGFPLWLIFATFVLFGLFKSIYDDAIKVWASRYIEAWLGPGVGTELMARLAEIIPSLSLAIATVWLLWRYIHREYSTRSLAFVRHLERPAGDFGHYVASVVVENTSPTQKMHNCRCEVLEFWSENGDVLERNIGLRTQGQTNKEVQGRFNMDQASTKELPVFEIDQSRDQGLTVINANEWDLHVDHGVYFALLRGYGDSGEPDEITVRIDSSNCDFSIVSPKSAASLGEQAKRRRQVIHDRKQTLNNARLKLAQLRSEGVMLRNESLTMQHKNGDYLDWARRVEAWMETTIDAVKVIDPADAEWFRTLDTVPQARVALAFPRTQHEGAHLKAHREHDFRLHKVDALLQRYANEDRDD